MCPGLPLNPLRELRPFKTILNQFRDKAARTRALHTLVPDMPTGDYSSLRKRILGQSVDPYRHLAESLKPVTIAVDSTGISVHKAGGWVERRTGRRGGM
jgi:hypothetical protein